MDEFSFRDDAFEDEIPAAESTSALDLSGLNPEQRMAVESLIGPLLVLAGPGSGKTRVITHRIANLLHHGVSDRNILALTFTNKAADEMKRRIRQLAPGADVWVGTFHRFCSRMLRRHASLVGLSENFSILDTADSAKVLTDLVAHEADEEAIAPRRVASIISMAKNNLLSPERFAEAARPGDERLAAKIYPRYQEALQVSNAVDFDDLLLYVAEMLQENEELRASLDEHYRYVMVDEYQDTNLAQYMIVRALSHDQRNLAVTGDPDQSIYGWRGASIENILGFERDYPETGVVRLERNYRSTPNILRVADALISHNRKRKPKRLITEREPGESVRLTVYPTYIDEASEIAKRIAASIASGERRPGEIAIFYRIHAISRVLERCLMERGIAYRVLNGAEFYQRKEVKDVLAYLQLLNNPQNGAAFLRIVNTPARGIGRKTLDSLVAHAQKRGLSMMDAAREAGVIEGLNKRAAVAIARFVTLIDRLNESLQEPVEFLMNRVLDLSGYEQQLADGDSADGTDRLENVRELISSAREFDSVHPEGGALEAYLEQVSLVSDTDGLGDSGEDGSITLMTLHSAKGLEYPCVYIMALEEEFIPHHRSRENHDDLEEERRLLFVGVTRAQEELNLSLAGYRMKRGSNLPTVPSMFLQELPGEELEVLRLPSSSSRWEFGSERPSEDPHPDPGDVYDDESWVDQSELECSPDGEAASPEDLSENLPDTSPQGLKVMTAADMLRAEEGVTVGADKTPPAADAADLDGYLSDRDAVHEGMVVNHPTYGAGTVLSSSGSGRKAAVSVRFFGDSRTRRFYLSHAQLQVVRSP